MSVVDIQAWADNVELVRLPQIEGDVDDLFTTTSQLSGELQTKSQEFTDRLDAHDVGIAAAQGDATAAGAAASAVSTEVYDARLDANTYTDLKHQQALDAIVQNNTLLRAYIDSDFAAYLEGQIYASDQLLSADIAAAIAAANNAKNSLNQEVLDLNEMSDLLLDQTLPAINQDLQDSLIRLVGLEYFNEQMFGGMQFPDIQALYDQLVGEIDTALEQADQVVDMPAIRKLINSVKIENAITAVQNVINSGASVVDYEFSVNNDAAIITEQTERIEGDTALANQVTAVVANIDSNTAAIVTEQTARADGDSALANQISIVSSTVSDNAAAIITEQTARADADSALSSDITSLIADVGTNAAAIVSEQTARADADTAIASTVSALGSRVGDNEANISNVQITKVDANGAIGAVEQEISATYDGLQALASETAFAKSTLDGIAAGYVWRVNGQDVMELVGISSGTSGPQVTAKIDADYVQITGLTQIDEAVITDLVATDAFIDNLAVGTLNIAGNAATVASFSDMQSEKSGVTGNWRGYWTVDTAYAVGDCVYAPEDNGTFICDVAHTSSAADEPKGLTNGIGTWDPYWNPAERFVTIIAFQIPAEVTAEIFIAANYSHGYTAGAKNWGFRITGGPLGGTTENLQSRVGMNFGNDYPVVTYIDTFVNNTASAQTYLVTSYWTGEDASLKLRAFETTLQIVARWR